MGEREFAIATMVLRATGYLGVLRVFIGLLCIGLGLLSAVEQVQHLQPLGPHGLILRGVHLAALVSALAFGAWWLLTPWPGHRRAIAFAVWGDVALAASAAVLAAPQARLSCTVYMCLIGVFIAVLLGYRMLLVHCAFATATIVALTWWAVRYDGVGLAELSLYFAPALATVVAMPVIAAVVVEGTRRGLGATAHAASRDPLTGLLNRRGLYAATDLMLARCAPSAIVVVAVIDLDGFKRVNDDHGHGTGDATLRALAEQLKAALRADDIAARVGGDEFVLVATLACETDLDGFVDRVRELTAQGADSSAVSISVGVAWQRADTPELTLDAVLPRADEAMYRAKRTGGRAVVVVEPPAAGLDLDV
ncbi:GGDEF domain-containing protein [Mycolicibacterium palauense]|uniref:GGDEF domain-containing protein n=1 Tax=Mycolicibacterium palauense TaxID=2034511 RepID=UPI000BFEB1F2|nr:GGDEF domain-containing protein [Mycolicibacterium palauense]